MEVVEELLAGGSVLLVLGGRTKGYSTSTSLPRGSNVAGLLKVVNDNSFGSRLSRNMKS